MCLVPLRSIARDLTLVLLAAGAFALDARLRLSAPGSRLAVVVGVSAGVLAAVVGFLLHEWGHLAGALAVKSRVHYPNRVFAPLLFHFESAHNDRRQFLYMSYGGYAASVLGVALIATLAPLHDWSGRVALALAGVGMLVTAVAEIPTTVRVHRGAALPDGYAFHPPR